MKHDFEQTLLQPITLSAFLMWRFVLEYSKVSELRCTPISHMALLLPLVYHRRTAAAIARMNLSSGLLKALADEPEIVVGLQWRLEQLASHSFQAIHLASSSGLLRSGPDVPLLNFTAGRRTTPDALKSTNKDVLQMHSAAKRLGAWLGKLDRSTVTTLLCVVY